MSPPRRCTITVSISVPITVPITALAPATAPVASATHHKPSLLSSTLLFLQPFLATSHSLMRSLHRVLLRSLHHLLLHLFNHLIHQLISCSITCSITSCSITCCCNHYALADTLTKALAAARHGADRWGRCFNRRQQWFIPPRSHNTISSPVCSFMFDTPQELSWCWADCPPTLSWGAKRPCQKRIIHEGGNSRT